MEPHGTRQSPFRTAPTLQLAKAPGGHVQPFHAAAGFVPSPVAPSEQMQQQMHQQMTQALAPLPPLPPPAAGMPGGAPPATTGGAPASMPPAGGGRPTPPAGTQLRRALSGQGRQLLQAGLRKPLGGGGGGGAPGGLPPGPAPPAQAVAGGGGTPAGGGGAGAGARPGLVPVSRPGLSLTKPSLNVHTAHAAKAAAVLLSSATTPRGSDGQASPLSDRLEEFYGRVKPEKQQDVAKIAAAYQGREDELNFRLHREYAQSLEPNSPLYMPLKIHLERFYAKYNPGKMTEIETIATFYKDKLGELNEKLRAQYGEDLHSQMV